MQPQKRGLEQRRPVRESRPAGQRQTPPKRAGQQRDAPMESPDDGPGWWRAKMWPLLERANERGFGAGMLASVLEEMMALDGVSRGGARDVPTSAPIETADGAKMCDDDVVESDAEALGATECDEAARPTVEAAPTVEELPAVDTAAAVAEVDVIRGPRTLASKSGFSSTVAVLRKSANASWRCRSRVPILHVYTAYFGPSATA